MTGNQDAGSVALLRDYGDEYQKTGKKLRYRWMFVDCGEGLTCIDTNLSNLIVKNALVDKVILDFAGFSEIFTTISIR